VAVIGMGIARSNVESLRMTPRSIAGSIIRASLLSVKCGNHRWLSVAKERSGVRITRV
jgi:hypothetical protein